MTDTTLIPMVDPRTVPGGMAHTKRRELPDGALIEFEEAPSGFLTKKGGVRQRDWRAYFYTPADGDRVRLPSVSTILDAISPKPGIPPWAEARGIEGTIEAIRRGELDPHDPAVDAVGTVRALRLGADRARDVAAERGVNVHALLESYMASGEAPDPSEHPPEHWGYIQALVRWILKAEPEPVQVEELVASPEDGYAGRMDLVARFGERTGAVDFKTQANAGIYESAHAQLALYWRGHDACGGEPIDFGQVVVLAEDGGFREMELAATPATVDAALDYWREMRPITSACESGNRFEKRARRA